MMASEPPLYRVKASQSPRFPPDLHPDSDGRVAVGGDLLPDTLIEAYGKGLFPWYEEPPIVWYSPDPRMVVFPSEYQRNRTLPSGWDRKQIEIRVNSCFDRVIGRCATISRSGQHGTWIHREIRESYLELHARGVAHSIEVFHRGVLGGGLYGVQLGAAFFGESMFSEVPGASRIAVTHLADRLVRDRVSIIDCQIYSPYLARCGGRTIPRREFRDRLLQALSHEQVPLR